jgi:hypothetical protein
MHGQLDKVSNSQVILGANGAYLLIKPINLKPKMRSIPVVILGGQCCSGAQRTIFSENAHHSYGQIKTHTHTQDALLHIHKHIHTALQTEHHASIPTPTRTSTHKHIQFTLHARTYCGCGVAPRCDARTYTSRTHGSCGVAPRSQALHTHSFCGVAPCHCSRTYVSRTHMVVVVLRRAAMHAHTHHARMLTVALCRAAIRTGTSVISTPSGQTHATRAVAFRRAPSQRMHVLHTWHTAFSHIQDTAPHRCQA